MEDIGFKKSRVENCVFYRHNSISIVYVDDGIYDSLRIAAINQAMRDIGEKSTLRTKAPWENTLESICKR